MDIFDETALEQEIYDPWFAAGYTEDEKALWKSFNSQFSLSMELGVDL